MKPQRAEGPQVERRNRTRAQPFSDCRHHCVDEAETQVMVVRAELVRANEVRLFSPLYRERFFRKVREECLRGARADVAHEQVVNLRQNGPGQDP